MALKDRFLIFSSQVQAAAASPTLTGRFGDLLERRDQLLAVLVLPFFIVAVFAFARVVHEIILEALPDAVGNIGAVVFLSGTVLVVASVAATFTWVKTGGFGLFRGGQ
jgi:hypothetical protein